ncbi:MAG: hypothetical protein HY706_14680 [Candidatus Hydrogenedentes bacterium]|nr:hypothetical protein [Candidatus Hydrogenedentota bacterium]
MSQKIAVAIIHGVGKQDPNFAGGMIDELTDRVAELLRGSSDDPAGEFVIEPVYWAPVLQEAEDRLWRRVKRGGALDFIAVRQFLIDFAADAIAYQPTPRDRKIYDAIHRVVAQTLARLAREAGPKAPLCVIAHSLGSVIASNYFYDLEAARRRRLLAAKVRRAIHDTPLEQGETLTLFYTLGSPIALWSLRYEDFGRPIPVPSPQLPEHFPGLAGEWLNFYDKDDIIGYPLRTLGDAYRETVKKDCEVNVGGVFTSWNPASHMAYWTDNDVTKPIADALARTWKAVNIGTRP